MGYSTLFTEPPSGWSITNHNLPIESIDRFIRLTADDSSALKQIEQAKKLPNMEIRYYFKRFSLGENHLNPQFEAVFTELPAGLVQEFHNHQDTCLEVTLVNTGRLLFIEHPDLTVEEVYEMMRSEFFFGIGDTLIPKSMHISDPNLRHTISSLTNATFWTWKLPLPQVGQPVFKTERRV